MILSAKHQNQQPLTLIDFSGGLNTSSTLNDISGNQLSYAVNVEIDSASGRLKTVAGTRDIFDFENIFAAVYDEINEVLLIVNTDREVYVVDFTGEDDDSPVGTLSGELYPIAAQWEDGVLLASGGRLQYFDGNNLKTIDGAPKATNVFVRAGRVVVVEDENAVRYSAVGDETNWTDDSNDESSAKFIEIGYKDGGKILGALNLSSDILFVKDNRHLYRLVGEYPNWTLTEISRNIESQNRLGMCTVADSVFILGRNEMQSIQTTMDYGDMKPTNIALLITTEIQSLPKDTMLRFIAPLRQIWCIAGDNVLVYDLVRQAWFKRMFNSPVLDAIPIGDHVLIIKSDRVSRLNDFSFSDDGKPLKWLFQAQRLLSPRDYFLKRSQVSFTPIDRYISAGEIFVGKVKFVLPPIEDETTGMKKIRIFGAVGVKIYENSQLIYGNENAIYNRPSILKESRNVYRNKYMDIKGTGKQGMILNSVTLTLVEV